MALGNLRRRTDQQPDHTPPWWVALVLIALFLLPIIVSHFAESR